MAASHQYPAPLSLAIPNGPRVWDDQEIPVSPVSNRSLSPLGPYSPAAYDCYLSPHETSPCAHARLECDQRYADLRADLERLQCQCGRGTWARRTRSWLGSFRRALSLKAHKKSEDAVRQPEWSHENHRPPPTEPPPPGLHVELGATPFIAELAATAPTYHSPAVPDPAARRALRPSTSGSYAHTVGCSQVELDATPFIPELSAAAVPYRSTVAFDPAMQMAAYPSTSGSYAQPVGYSQVGYNANTAVGFSPQVAFQLPVQVPCPSELVAPGPYYVNRHTGPAWYSSQPSASFRAVSPLKLPTMSTQGSMLSVSPQSSISSVSSSQFSNTVTVPVSGAPMYASHTTDSPREIAAPWNRQNSWDSTTTMAELAGSSLDSLPKSAQWLQDPVFGELPELEELAPGQFFAGFPEMEGSVVRQPFAGLPEMEGFVPPQPFVQTQEMEPQELATGTNVPFDLGVGQWPTSQMTGMENIDTEMVASDVSWTAVLDQPMHLPLQPGPRRPTSPARQNSLDSTANTVLDLAMSSGGGDPDAPSPFNFPPHRRAFEEAPIQQRARVRRASAARGKKTQPGSISCEVCEFFPSGDGRRRKVRNHLQTNGHKKRMGEEAEGPKFLCWICSTTVNRLNNLWQHAKDHHGERPDSGQSWMEYYQSLQVTS